ncbi:MAG: hypothetical protein LBE13_14370, partial [Bacteroidales bacterium]|nr:hypothetical protein [Bacteroidales bacterium]
GERYLFSIEWEIKHQYKNGWITAYFSFWANNRQIGEGYVELKSVVFWIETYLKIRSTANNEYWKIPIDFSGISKEEIYDRFQACYTAEFPERYKGFYIQCKKLMIDAYRSPLMKQKYVPNSHSQNEEYFERKYQRDIEKSILLGDSFEEDYALCNWIQGTFEIGSLVEPALDGTAVFIVHEITNKQDRIIWRHFELFDDNSNVIQTFPIEEAILPLGYFYKVLNEFIETVALVR